jgi:hypothetical protein
MALPQDQIHFMTKLTMQLQAVLFPPVAGRESRDLKVQAWNGITRRVCADSNDLIYG